MAQYLNNAFLQPSVSFANFRISPEWRTSRPLLSKPHPKISRTIPRSSRNPPDCRDRKEMPAPSPKPDPTLTALVGGISFGVNGVHTREGFLYFTITELGFFPDFTFDGVGDAYIARGRVDLIRKITPAGKVVSLDYENLDTLVLIEGNTAAKFGRTKSDRRMFL
ncbi:uncharacterized protein K444DRAFT_638934 [Hyaloscypha bicolor E]|uniref:Uncharacterized protein n=1 Tax=Hyaloscypha bicolor E TaxID=1095630 RepID=A0A2J6SFA2_9HELO|nr:uncharacterized protein K444DRAFT_638934 [Hyaloscypha bicolor E]PMD49451.1 hypothetical protein K444DRAFT_638934 [Hyaloscypha bicolor E]